MAALAAQDQEAVVLMRTPPGQAQPPLGLAVITLAAEVGTRQPPALCLAVAAPEAAAEAATAVQVKATMLTDRLVKQIQVAAEVVGLTLEQAAVLAS